MVVEQSLATIRDLDGSPMGLERKSNGIGIGVCDYNLIGMGTHWGLNVSPMGSEWEYNNGSNAIPMGLGWEPTW